MRCAEAVCSQYNSPDGVAFCFQVCLNSIEPTFSNRCLNLFANDKLRVLNLDEFEEGIPELGARVFKAFAFPGVGEGLAGKRG